MIEIICQTCGEKFEVYNYRKNTANFCSRKCKRFKWKKSKMTIIEKECKICKKVFKTYPYRVKKGEGKYCSRKCFDIWQKSRIGYWKGKKLPKYLKEKLRQAKLKNPVRYWLGKKMEMMQGNKNPNWKGGRKICNYIIIWTPNGYIPEHRYIMEKHIGRKLKCTEIVHHIDENKHNNRLDNIMLFPNTSAHLKYHWALKLSTTTI